MEGDYANQEAAKLLEDAWFFGNSLKNKPKLLEDDDDFGPRMGDLIRQAMPNKLTKTPSLPIYRTKKEFSLPKMTKLSRMSSLDPSLLMPTKYKEGRELHTIKESKPRKRMTRSMSLKRLSDTEVQGFQDLGFTFDNEDLCPAVVDKLARLEIKKESDQIEVGKKGKMNPSISEPWSATETQWAYSPPVPKWVDTKSSDQDMKEQIKFWAKSVASNANQDW